MRPSSPAAYVGRVGDLVIRPMTAEDVSAAERLSDDGFLEVDRQMQPRSWPEPTQRAPDRAARWRSRTRHFLRTDPGGSWVAEADGEVVGVATGFVRETTWCLATYVVRPGLQGRGIGRPLLEAAMAHGRSCLHAMLSASADPRALRRYHAAGFRLHPQMSLGGVLDRALVPPVEKVREGSAGDRDLLDSVDRQTRGAAHGPDHEWLAGFHPLLVSDTTTGSGYVYVDASGGPVLLAATNRRTASRLLWAALALAPDGGEVAVRHVTAANQWAVDVGMAARLSLHQEGYLAVRGMEPPAPYIHDGALL